MPSHATATAEHAFIRISPTVPQSINERPSAGRCLAVPYWERVFGCFQARTILDLSVGICNILYARSATHESNLCDSRTSNGGIQAPSGSRRVAWNIGQRRRSARRDRSRVEEAFGCLRSLPGWVTSSVVHAIIILVLALLTIPLPDRTPRRKRTRAERHERGLRGLDGVPHRRSQ